MCPANETISSELFKNKEDYERVCGVIFDLWHQNQQYKKILFGQKSERHISTDDLSHQLLLGDIDAKEKPQTREIAAHTRKAPEKRKPKRQALPEHLERITTEIIPDEVAADPDAYIRIGENVTEQLEIKPTVLWVNRTVRPKFKKKDADIFCCGQLPPMLFEKFSVGNSIIAHILTAKYCDHLPLYRIRKQFNRSKVDFPESTMVGWIHAACKYLEPLYNYMHSTLKGTHFVNGDETPIPVLDRGKKKAHKGQMYVYILDKRYALFDYRRGRGSDGPRLFLKGYSGIFLTDGYAGYNEAIEAYGLTHITCMAHIRRKFKEAFEAGFKDSEIALELIRKLYDIEEKIRGQELSVILSTRQEESKPIYDKLHDWAVEIKQKGGVSPTVKAVNYFLNRHPNMKLYLEHPEADIDNNHCERTIRPMTIGRKNYMFAGSDKGAWNAAIIYSMVLTCRIHGVDPYAWFMKIFELMATHPEMELAKLLPDQLKI